MSIVQSYSDLLEVFDGDATALDSLITRLDISDIAPSTSLLESELSFVHTTSNHEVEEMRITSGPEEGKIVFFKKCHEDYPIALAQIEAAACASLRITQGYIAPKMRPVVDDSAKMIGLVSYEYSGFRTIDDKFHHAIELMQIGIVDGLIDLFIETGEELLPDAERNYSIFLKEVLIDFETHMNIAKPYFAKTETDQALFQCFQDSMMTKWNEREDRLIHDKAFRKYIVQMPSALQDCKEHFEKYNQTLAPEGISFDLGVVNKKYEAIIKKCMLKDGAMTLYDLGCQWKLNGIDEEPFGQLIALFEAFEQSYASLYMLYGELKKHLETAGQQLLLKAIDNYKGLITVEHCLPTQTVPKLALEKTTVSIKAELNIELCLANATYEFLSDANCKPRLDAILQDCLAKYTPLGHGQLYGSLNPMSYCRERTPEITVLQKNIRETWSGGVAPLIMDFLKTGAWNESWYLREASVNVMLLSQICLAVLDQFKNQLTLTDLRQNRLTEVCFLQERKELNLEKSAKSIYEQMKLVISSHNTGDFLF